MRRGADFAWVAILFPLVGCTDEQDDNRKWVASKVPSTQPAPALANCIRAEWSKFSTLVQVAPYEQGKAVRIVHPDLGVIFQALVIPAPGGSTLTLGSPFEAQFPNYAPVAEKCAGKT